MKGFSIGQECKSPNSYDYFVVESKAITNYAWLYHFDIWSNCQSHIDFVHYFDVRAIAYSAFF